MYGPCQSTAQALGWRQVFVVELMVHSILTSLSRYWPFFLATLSILFLVITKGITLLKDWFELRNARLEGDEAMRDARAKYYGAVQLATLEDVERYDPKVRQIKRARQDEMFGDAPAWSIHPLLRDFLLLFSAIVAIAGVAFLVYIIKR
jgi:hypothetical protein